MKQVMGSVVAVLAVLVLPGLAAAQPGGKKGPAVVSPEVKADRHVVFRILAPKASSVGVFSTDIPGGFKPRPMKKGDDGVWEATLGPIDAGTYRYVFNVDGVQVIDPRFVNKPNVPLIASSAPETTAAFTRAGELTLDVAKRPSGSRRIRVCGREGPCERNSH